MVFAKGKELKILRENFGHCKVCQTEMDKLHNTMRLNFIESYESSKWQFAYGPFQPTGKHLMMVRQVKPANQRKQKFLKSKNFEVGVWKRLVSEEKVILTQGKFSKLQRHCRNRQLAHSLQKEVIEPIKK